MFTHSISCSSVITKGGAKRMISPCVGFASRPLSRSNKHSSQAVFGEPSDAVRGSITNVIGLPLAEVVALLRATGAAPIHLARGRAA